MPDQYSQLVLTKLDFEAGAAFLQAISAGQNIAIRPRPAGGVVLIGPPEEIATVPIQFAYWSLDLVAAQLATQIEPFEPPKEVTD
jgi:hypothetical protein